MNTGGAGSFDIADAVVKEGNGVTGRLQGGQQVLKNGGDGKIFPDLP